MGELRWSNVAVVGQGYVGLPLAMRAVEVGYHVVGYETDENRVKRLQTGESYVEDVPRVALTTAIDSGRYRPSELAARVGLSKQAANDVLREFEAGGYITLVPDPDDGRAKRIQATERGAALEMTASRLSSDVARRWAEQVGEERFAQFEQVLREIVNPQGAPRR